MQWLGRLLMSVFQERLNGNTGQQQLYNVGFSAGFTETTQLIKIILEEKHKPSIWAENITFCGAY